MSAQAGVFYFDGRPPAAETVALIGRALEAYGPDDGGEIVQPGLVMVHRALHVTPEDRGARQPFVSKRGHLMTWDGRLDNRADLRLQLWHDRDADGSDVALAMRAYERWGQDGFARLIGDWSLVVWDAARRTVVMASDYMGVRPLHYYRHHDAVSWSTTLECLVHLHGLYDRIDPHYLVGMLATARPAGVTPYIGVRAVPPARSVSFTAAGDVAEQRFWRVGSAEIRYRREADYEAHLRSVFLGALQGRLRATAPVWSQLSGGLDSSAIVCGAEALLAQGLAAAPDLRTVSYVIEGSPATDERRFVACVDAQRGRATQFLRLDDAVDHVDAARHWLSPVQLPRSTVQTYALMQRTGGRLLLTGIGGDGVMGHITDYHHDVAEQLGRLRPWAALGAARRRALAARRSIWDVLYAASRELRPSRILVRRMMANTLAAYGARSRPTDAGVAACLHLKPAFARWWRQEWADQCARALAFPDRSRRPLAAQVVMMSDRRHGQAPSDEPMALTSHPFLDRPLVEFMLGVPLAVMAPPGQPRGLMRRAFAPFMPPRIVARFSKGYAPPLVVADARALLGRWLRAPDALKILQHDFLDPDRLLTYLRTLHDTGDQPELFVLLVRIEQWLEAREPMVRQIRASGPAAMPPRDRRRQAAAIRTVSL